MSNLDLKDLEILETLHRIGNVSSTAETMGLSQPSISIRLKRLRAHFQDPLFVRTSEGMLPTPRASALIPAIRSAIGLFDGTVGGDADFDPATSTRVFKICMTNTGQIVVLPRLLNHLDTVAPRIALEVRDLDSQTPRRLETGEADLAMGFTLEIQAGFYQQKMFGEHYVCLVRKGHPRIGASMTRREFLGERHVAVTTFGTGHWLVDKAIEDAGLVRNIALRVPSFLGLAEIVATTDLLALAPIHLAEVLTRDKGIKVLKVPFKLPSYLVKQYWHERFHRDPGNRWLRGVIVEMFRD